MKIFIASLLASVSASNHDRSLLRIGSSGSNFIASIHGATSLISSDLRENSNMSGIPVSTSFVFVCALFSPEKFVFCVFFVRNKTKLNLK